MRQILLQCFLPLAFVFTSIFSFGAPGSGSDLNFDGTNDYVDLNTHASSVIFNAPATIEFWFKSDVDHKSGGGVIYSVSDGNASGSGENFTIAYGTYDGNVSNERITIAHNEGSTNTMYHLVDAVGSYTSQWHHYAITCSGTAFGLYIDGVDYTAFLAANPSYTTTYAGDYGENISTASKVTFGAEELSGLGNYIDGDIDEMRLWSVVLTQTEIRDWMVRKETSSHPQHANIVGYWNFDDGSGSTLTDNGGSSYNGTLTNFALSGLSSNWLTSGAAIGDNSSWTYTVSDTLSLKHANGDSLFITDLANGPVGAHIYYVDESPNVTTAPTNYDSLAVKRYWGVFPIGTIFTTYTVYDMYNNFPTTGDQDARRLVSRSTNAQPSWANAGAMHIEGANLLLRPAQIGNKEYTIGFRANSTDDRPGPANALDFDGTDDRIDLGTSASFDFSTGACVEAWIRPKTPSTDGHIVSNSGQWDLILESDRNVSFRIRKSDNTAWVIATTSTPITNEKWAHVAGTYDGTDVKIFVNGEQKASASYTGSIYTGAGSNTYIGSEVSANYVKGEIDEVRLWKSEVSTAALQRWACKKLNITHTNGLNMISYYRLDEMSGSAAEDLMGSLDGTLENMTNGDWITSSAVIGDLSEQDYTSPDVVVLPYVDLSNTTRDSITVDITSGSPTAVQLVVTTESPNVTAAPGDLAALEVKYWEVFVIGGTSPTYELKYHYGSNPLVADENKIMMTRRDSAGAAAWTVLNSEIDKTKNIITKTSEGEGQYCLGSSICNWQEWTGTTSTAWALDGNWCGSIPSSTVSASIPNPILSGNSPIITAAQDVHDLSIASGSTLTNNSTLNIYGNVTATGDLTGDGTSTVNYVGTTAQTITGAVTYDYLVINNSTGVTVSSGEQTVVDSLKVTAGTLTTGGAITLQSDATQTARLCEVAGTISGDITCQLYLPDGIGWRFLSAPVSDATLASVKDDIWTTGFTGSHYPTQNNNVYSYDETVTGSSINGYTQPDNITNDMAEGKGFQFYVNPVEVTIDWTGTVNTGNVSIPVSYTVSAGDSDDGWCFVGNPYPSVINWDAAEWTKTNMEDAIYMYDAQGLVYATYIAQVGANGGTKHIPAYNGFWVKANATSPVLTVTEACKANQAIDFWKTSSNQNELIRLQLESGQYKDETILKLDPEGTFGFDTKIDATKMYSGSALVPEIASLDDEGVAYAINGLSESEVTAIPININVKKEGWVTLNVNYEGQEWKSSCSELTDIINNVSMPLSEPIQYEFYVNSAFKGEHFQVTKSENSPNADFSLNLVENELEVINMSSNAANFEWRFGDGTSSNKIAPAHTYSEDGIYTVELVAENGACKSIKSYEIEVGNSLVIAIDEKRDEVTWYNLDQTIQANVPDRFTNASYQVIDLSGRIVTNGQVSGNSLSLDKKQWTNGTYVLSIIADQGILLHKKFVSAAR